MIPVFGAYASDKAAAAAAGAAGAAAAAAGAAGAAAAAETRCGVPVVVQQPLLLSLGPSLTLNVFALLARGLRLV